MPRLALPALLLLCPALARAQASDLTLHCDGCFGMEVTLDGEHLLFAGGLGAGTVDGKLQVHHQAELHGLAPGPHHIRVVVLQGPLDSQVYYDGPIYLRPSRDIHMRALYGNLVDFEEDPLPEAATDGGSARDAGPPSMPAPARARVRW